MSWVSATVGKARSKAVASAWTKSKSASRVRFGERVPPALGMEMWRYKVAEITVRGAKSQKAKKEETLKRVVTWKKADKLKKKRPP